MTQKTIMTGLVLCSLMLTGSPVGGLVGNVSAQENPAAVPAPRDTTGKNKWVTNHYGRMMKLAEKSPEKFKVVFVGDSITKKWLDMSGTLWKENFGDPDSPFYALNLGVPGDKTDNVLYRLKSEADGGLGNLDNDAIQPEAIVLMIGTNNIFPPHSAEQIAGGIETVALRLRELRPNADLIICSIIPSHNGTKDQKQIIPANETLPSLAERLGDKVRFLDLFPAFLNEEGKKEKSFYHDGLHLNEEGYKVWFSKLMPVLEEVLSVEAVGQ